MTKNKTTARCVCAKYPRTTPPPPENPSILENNQKNSLRHVSNTFV